MRYILNSWLLIIFLLSIFAITNALIAEFIFDLAPCKMCLKQRYAYYAIILIVILFYIFKKTNNLWLFILNEFSIIYGLFYSIWHIGIEQKIIAGPLSCSGILLKTDSITNLKKQINDQAIVSCADVSWTILGISAASINGMLLILILVLNTTYIYQRYYGHKKID